MTQMWKLTKISFALGLHILEQLNSTIARFLFWSQFKGYKTILPSWPENTQNVNNNNNNNVFPKMCETFFSWKSERLKTSNRNIRKIYVLPMLARMDPKIQKRMTTAKKCCGWEKPAICQSHSFKSNKWLSRCLSFLYLCFGWRGDDMEGS